MFKPTIGCPEYSIQISLRPAPLIMFLFWLFACSLHTQASGSRIISVQPPQQQQQKAGGQNVQQVTTLEPGKPVERELAGGQKHSYKITPAEGQYVSVLVEQRGVDVSVKVSETNGRKILRFDAEVRSRGQEKAEWVAETSGGYKLSVENNLTSGPAGRYVIRLEELRPATRGDRSLDEARQESDAVRSRAGRRLHTPARLARRRPQPHPFRRAG